MILNSLNWSRWKQVSHSRDNEQIRELLSFYKYPGDDIPVIKGSALCALEGKDDKIGKEKVLELMKTVDEYFPDVGIN